MDSTRKGFSRTRFTLPTGLAISLLKRAAILSIALSLIGSAQAAKHGKSEALLNLSKTAGLLDAISKKSQNPVPDAVLNNTKCFVVIPAINGEMIKGESNKGETNKGLTNKGERIKAEKLTGESVNTSAGGVATCREVADAWSVPAFVKFEGHGLRAHSTDLLVFVLTDAGERALQSGQLPFAAQKAPAAPLVTTTPVTTQVELAAELLTYEGTADDLSSSEASGVIRADTPDPTQKTAPKKATDKYLSSVVSFFNAITPTGIVIHHTAVIPGKETVPRKARDIDQYHRERGFEIRCSGRVYHVAYHYLVMPDGKVKTGRPERCEGAHAAGYNSYLGISVVGDFSSEDNPTAQKGPAEPTAKQMASLVKLCRRLKDRYNIPLQHIVRHSDISSTQCPGDRFPFKSVLDQLLKPGPE